MPALTDNAQAVRNVLMTRTALLNSLLDGRRDYNKECGYPDAPTAAMYGELYDRHGVATRAVAVYPQECWTVTPDIYEQEEQEQTPFEEAFDRLCRDNQLLSYLARVDEMSGVGHFGLLLLGLDDGGKLEEEVPGVAKRLLQRFTDAPDAQQGDGQPPADDNPDDAGGGYRLLYLRVFEERQVTVAKWESDLTNPRYGQPVLYNVQLQDPRVPQGGEGLDHTNQRIHWTRVVHVADNRKTSETFGVPRLRPILNYLLDLRKVGSGSGEMFWRGGFPGTAYELLPELAVQGVTLDEDEKKSIKAEIDAYQNSMQRYQILTGFTAKSLGPQVADPEPHLDAQLKLICVTLGVPLRIFMGSEQAQLASGQDRRNWNGRLTQRQKDYLTPYVVRPTIDLLMACGVLPQVDEYHCEWPDMNTPSDQERADVAAKETDALAKYVGGGVDTLVPPKEYLTGFLGRTADEADAILEAAAGQIDTIAGGDTPPGRSPQTPGEAVGAELDLQAKQAALDAAKAQADGPPGNGGPPKAKGRTMRD